MVDNTKEEHSDIPTNKQLESFSDELTPNTNQEMSSKNKEPQNMEVHHHTHDPSAPHHKKNFLSYFWEFLMLFLAVFCGFLAEYQLEHKIESNREIQFIRLISEDITTDISKLNKNIMLFKENDIKQNSVLEALPTLEKGFSLRFYNNFISFQWFPDFIYTDATIQQLKNSGGFRLIKNYKVIAGIMNYDAEVKKALINESTLGRVMEKSEDFSNDILNTYHISNQLKLGITSKKLEIEGFDYLLSNDRIPFSRFANHLLYHRKMCNIVTENMESVKFAGAQLLILLKTEYDLD
jgi:hypothetical protein